MYLTQILDERTFKNRRFVLEYSATEHTYVLKSVYKIPNEQTAKTYFEKITATRVPKAIDPEVPAPKKTTRKKRGVKNE